MKDVETRCKNTTQHIANKFLYLKRANKLIQKTFAEKVNLYLRTIARAESSKHRSSAQKMKLISLTFQIPISYFF